MTCICITRNWFRKNKEVTFDVLSTFFRNPRAKWVKGIIKVWKKSHKIKDFPQEKQSKLPEKHKNRANCLLPNKRVSYFGYAISIFSRWGWLSLVLLNPRETLYKERILTQWQWCSIKEDEETEIETKVVGTKQPKCASLTLHVFRDKDYVWLADFALITYYLLYYNHIIIEFDLRCSMIIFGITKNKV